MRKFSILILLIISLMVASCSDGGGREPNNMTPLTVSAAVSLQEVLEDIKPMFEQDYGVELTFNLGGSGTLARQIQQGAPSDVFISADQEWMDILEKEGQLIASTRRNITGNQMVLVTAHSSPIDYDSMEQLTATDVDQIAIGNPESVPAGKYAEAILHSLNIWDEVEDKLVLAKDVRQVLTYVESGNADVGFVYESDAMTSDQVQILAAADPAWHDPIYYPGAVIAGTTDEKEAEAFLQFLQTDQVQAVLKKYGFATSFK